MTLKLGRRGHLPNPHEVLLSLNIGLAVAIGLKVYVSRFPSGRNMIADVFIRTLSRINGLFHLVQYDHVGVDITLVALTIGSALAALLLLRVIALTTIAHPIVDLTGGLVAIATLPICWFYISSVLWPVPPASGVELFLFAGVPIACVLLYFYGMWPIPTWGTIPILALYYGFWSWMLWQHFTHDFRVFLLPAVGLCSSVAWGLFITKQEVRTSLAE
jgi:hypothetical protein